MALNQTGTIGATSPAAGSFGANHAYYVREFVEIADPEMVYDMFGTPKDIEPNSSNKIVVNKVLKLSTLEDSPLTEGVTPTEQQATLERIEQTINQYGGYLITTDRLTTESINGLTSKFNSIIARQGGETMNKVVRDDLLGGTNVRYANGVADQDSITASGVYTADFTYMFQAFKTAHAKPFRPIAAGSQNIGTLPTRETYPVVVSVEASDLLEALDDSNGNTFTNAEKYASQRAIWPNEYGTYKQFSFILDTEANTETNGADTPQEVCQSLVFARDAYHVTRIGASDVEIIVKELGSSGVTDALNQRSSIGWKAKKGAIIKQPTYLFRYEFSLGDA